MRFQFERCKERGKIVSINKSTTLVKKELKEAQNDLKWAATSINEDNYKWAIVQSYYSMFHAFRALLFNEGYREKSHFCLKQAIEALFVDKGIINSELLDDFDFAMKSREKADYSYSYNDKLAKDIFNSANQLVFHVNNLIQ